ncbi:hypothetical protein A3709_10450 [Halioglobus sp. HI00S01]|uniref:glycosyltransferase n=1 Tax=Halioglobus sp. HI00S01 TaxID=1822214 RepID=UPI0007C3019E|nr:glycosyltransferase [Halioglobus sp. HI00S01]KZX51242.1 hypothetical protein A3709_10450 [Halioglobus sp. HI00S01]
MAEMKPSVLYISYTGILDPLGESQVLQYVIGLSKKHKMVLLTFEKPEALKDEQQLSELKRTCSDAGVEWHYHHYHRRPNLPATFYDLLVGIFTGTQLARRHEIDIVHCRSYLAGLMGLAVKRLTGTCHIFDMRGFWPDERVDGGVWTKASLRYRLFKRLERTLLLGTDYVVSLTRSGVTELTKFDYLEDRDLKVSVIPTCTNLQLFSPVEETRPSAGSGFVMGYVGSAGSWYMFDQVAKAVKQLFDQLPESRFLVLNKGGHTEILRHLESEDVDISRVELKSVPYQEVSQHIACMTAGISFIKPAWSKRASSPTRLGEFLACGKPLLANAGVGDVESDLLSSGTGVVIKGFSDEELSAALASIIELVSDPELGVRCRETAERQFSLQAGVEEYSSIYLRLEDKR